MTEEKENNQEVQSCPSYNPADLTTTAGMLNYIFRCNSMTTDNCIPAIVEKYDRKKHVVTVKPCINITAATGETIERESLPATVMSICGGNFIMNFPLKEGDTGWLITADRDISLFREQRKVINANTDRIHSIEDSFFIPDRVNDFKVEEEDENNLIIQTLGRNVKISIGEDEIKITNKTKQDDGDEEGGDEGDEEDGDGGDDVETDNGESEDEDTKEQSDETTVSIREGEIGISVTGSIKIKAEKKSSDESEDDSEDETEGDSDEESDDESDKTSIYMDDQEISIETNNKVVVKAKNNVSCTVEEGDIECECKNLTATVEENIECKCANLTAEAEEDIECKCVNLTAEVESEANIKATTITLDGDVNITGNLNIDGQTDCASNLSVSGNTDCSGTVTGSDVVGGSISLSSHVHGGVQSGGSMTGGPL